MKDALYLLLVLVGLFVALVALSIGKGFVSAGMFVMSGVKRVRSWGRR
jgi:hypothetical protein